MPDGYKLRQVFSRGMPTVTYVKRAHLGLEQELHKAVARGHAIIAVTGPSKCGKTVSRRTVIPDQAAVHVEGGQIGSEDDFWEAIRSHLEMPISESKAAAKQAGSSSGFGVSVGPSFAKASLQVGENGASTRTDTRTFSGPQKGQLLRHLITTNDVLVIDDFHCIEGDVRARLVRSLKSAVFDGLSVVMLSVPYRAFDVLTAEAEMEGRFTHLSIPTWTEADLMKIGEQGFPALGLEVPPDVQERFARESLGSPLLMQSLCAQLCSEIDFFETTTKTRQLQSDDVNLDELFRAVARDFGLPAFTKLSAGPQSRTDRNPRRLVNGRSGDIYEAVLAAVAYSGASEAITYDDLRSALRDVLVDTPPQKHETTRAIQYMCDIAKRMQIKDALSRDQTESLGTDLEGNSTDIPTIDWQDDTLQINDVFLRFYLQWIHRPKVLAQQ